MPEAYRTGSASANQTTVSPCVSLCISALSSQHDDDLVDHSLITPEDGLKNNVSIPHKTTVEIKCGA